MGEVRVFVTRDAAKFAEHTADFLADRPIEHNVLATVAAALEARGRSDPPLFAWVQSSESGKVSAAVLRAPPWRLLASSMSAEAAAALMPKLLEADPELPGVNGPQPAASHLAEAWRRCAGGKVEPVMSQAIYSLAHVIEPPRPPAGDTRFAHSSDRDLMIEWMRAFNREAGMPEVGASSEIDGRLRDQRLFVWDDDGVVSMVGIRPPVAGVVRLGPVYTPPAARRRGYATALVADVSRRALSGGATKCILYTDLANPTSNSIYQAVGYQHSVDAQMYAFRSAVALN